MKILDQLIDSLNMDAPVKDICQGVFDTAVLTRHCGLAATLPRDALRQSPPLVVDAGELSRQTARQLVGLAYSNSILEAAIGMATINSLIDVDDTRCDELNAAELIIDKGRDRKVAIIGHFPFVDKVRKKAKSLWVIEKNPKPGDLEEDKAAELIPDADVVAITGTALTHHSLEPLLALCHPSAFVLLLGASAPLSPVLFDFGVDAICGTWVSDPPTALRCVAQGANYRQIKGVKRLTLLR